MAYCVDGLFYLKGSLVVVVFDVLIGSSEQQHSGTTVLQNQQHIILSVMNSSCWHIIKHVNVEKDNPWSNISDFYINSVRNFYLPPVGRNLKQTLASSETDIWFRLNSPQLMLAALLCIS